MLGRVCAQIVSADKSPSPNTMQRDFRLIAHVITCALHPELHTSRSKRHVDSVACALLNFLAELQPQADALSALATLAACLGTQHLLFRHVQVLVSGKCCV